MLMATMPVSTNYANIWKLAQFNTMNCAIWHVLHWHTVSFDLRRQKTTKLYKNPTPHTVDQNHQKINEGL